MGSETNIHASGVEIVIAGSVEGGSSADVVLSSQALRDRYPRKGSMPAEFVEKLYELRETEVRHLALLPEVSPAHLHGLDWGARALVADLLFTRCNADAQRALLDDSHHFVRSTAALVARAAAGAAPHPSKATVSRVDAIDRREAIAQKLATEGFRMEYDPGAIPGEGHLLIRVANGQMVDDPDDAIAHLAREWSDLTDAAESDET
jgi:hypothetical protein